MLKRFLPRTLFGRSLLIIVSPLILVQVIATYVFFENHWNTVARRLAGGLAGDIAAVVASLREFPGAENRATVLAMARAHMQLKVTLKEGEILPNVPPPRSGDRLERMLSRALGSHVRRPFQIDAVSHPRSVEINLQLQDGVLTVIASRKRLFSSTTYVFVMWMVGSSLILFAVATMFMRNQVRPIRLLAAAADSFGKGRDVPDFKPSGAIEVRQAASAFNNMRQRIQRQINQRTEMLAGVSHDLRTPLTRMKLQLAMLEDTPEAAELKADVVEMEKMLEGYLEFARGEETEAVVPTDLNALLSDVVNGARRAGGKIELNADGAMNVPLRPAAFKRCVANVVANAVRYADHVVVGVAKKDNGIEITIDDDGPGIPEDQWQEVFRPFHRLESSRNVATGGVGLGLTIARDVMHGHGGSITLDQSPTGGLRACLRLPL